MSDKDQQPLSALAESRGAKEYEESQLLASFLAPRLPVKDRLAAGKALRKQIPRAALAEYRPPSGRIDPVSVLEAQAKSRLPHLVPLRHTRMLASPFAFLRGAAAIMASDIGAAPTTGIRVQACGDMHVSNFGVFASAERNLVFGINDFDETYPAPWEWDLKRLTTSCVVAGRYLGFDEIQCEEAVRSAVSTYRQRMRGYADMSYLDLWYSTMDDEDVLAILSPKVRKRAMQVLDKARTRTHLQVLGKMTDLVDDEHRIREEAPYVVRETHTEDGTAIVKALDAFMQSYVQSMQDDRRFLLERYRIMDVARKVVGVGSVGTRCWVVFLAGKDAGDPLFLQVKEAQPSVLAPHQPPLATGHQGRRIISGQRLIQGAPDIFLGWGSIGGRDFYVRQLRDMKGGIDLVPGATKPQSFIEYAGLCGWALALAHAKSGDAAMIAGYVGKGQALDEALALFARAYAAQTEHDHAAMAMAARSGRIQVAEGGGDD